MNHFSRLSIASGHLTFCVVLFGVMSAAAAGPASAATYSTKPEDQILEGFLREADVVENVPVGEGITEPHKLTLRQGATERHAIFKDIDVELDQVTRTNRYESRFSDRYAYEVAAYRLDRYLGLGLVPVTVVGEVDGTPGSIQLWIENHRTLSSAMEENLPVGDHDLLVQRLTVMFVFDSLIGNIDRNFTNVLVDLDHDSFFLIDHSRSFRTETRIDKMGEGKGVPIPAAIAERLRSMSRQELNDLLGDLLSQQQIRSIVARRDRLLKVLAKSDLLPS